MLFVSVLTFGALGFAPSFAHAQEADGGDYSGGCCGGSYSTGADFTSNPVYDNGQGSYSTGADFTTNPTYDQGSYSTGAEYYSQPSYDTTTGTGGGYSTNGYSTGGYSTGGYSTGGYTTGSGYMVGGTGYSTGYYTQPTYSTPVSTPSNTYAPVNTWDNGNTYAPTTVTDTTTDNTCTGNSCNSDDHSVVNITNPAPVINNNNVVDNYTPPQTTSVQTPVVYVQNQNQNQVCASGYYGTYPNCYINQAPYSQPVVYQQPQVYQQPVAYQQAAPYVSLTQVPYTGLDLGFWGTIAYWGFMVVFALFAAYLIAVKRVQNNVARYLKVVLFGADDEAVAVPATVAYAEVAVAAPAVAHNTNSDVIDSFIMSQINRTRIA